MNLQSSYRNLKEWTKRKSGQAVMDGKTGVDPVRVGLLASLKRPGGNITGVTQLGVEMTPKDRSLPQFIALGFVWVLHWPWFQQTDQ
jgi:hypothetical protein